MYDFVIIGGGIVGLSVVMRLLERAPGARVLLLEKEGQWAAHQTGRNSGVIHSGIYYKPGSYKARFARDGNRSMVAFCQEHGIKHDICGKVIVATERKELPLLENVYQRGLANGLAISKIGPDELHEIEPYCAGIAAIRVPSAGIVNYRQVAQTYARLIEERGGELRLNTKVERIINGRHGVVIETNNDTFHTRFVINCAGLHSDRVAKLGAVPTNAQIVPFRGEYYELKPEKRYLVKHLIYPVPNPDFPFLGVHFTRMIGGDIHAGPNAVLSLKREGYTKLDINLRDAIETLTYPGFLRLARKNWHEGLNEMIRSFSKAAFVRSLQKLIPEVQADDLVPSQAGVRAQALRYDGGLVDDFLIVQNDRSIHVCNAPSPAATASLEIGKAVVDHISSDKLDTVKAVVV